MDVTWFLIGLGVGALAIYIWLRRKTQEMIREHQIDMARLRQPGNYQRETSAPSGTTNSFAPKPIDSGSEQSKTEFEKLENMISNLQQTVDSLQDKLKALSTSIAAILPNLDQPTRGHQSAANKPPEKTRRSTSATVGHYPGLANAVAAYRKLSCEGLRDLPVEPLFVVLDIDSSARGSAIGETKRHFNEFGSKQSAFVIFSEGEKDGWIFPNPRISFTEAMKYVFPDLSYENFEEAKDRVEPQRVHSVSQGAWETVAT